MDELSLRNLITKTPRTDKIPGGLAKHTTVGEIARMHKVPLNQIIQQLMKGAKVEKEHTTDMDIALEIAFDHIYEDPIYYDKIKGL